MIKINKTSLETASIRQIILRMKLISICLFIGINVCLASESYAQSARFSLDIKSKSVKDAFAEIENQGEFIFFYQDEAINTEETVTIKGKDMTINQVLDQLFDPSENSYEIANRQIFVYKNPTTTKSGIANQTTVKISGKVVDESSDPLPGASIRVVGRTHGVSTDLDGNFTLVVEQGSMLEISFLGMQTQQFLADKDIHSLTIVLKENASTFEDVTVVAFAKQKKSSVVSAISTINPGELKVPSSNLTTALAGRMAGIISYQRSGEPGQDNAQFFIRGVGSFGKDSKKDPLILIDNIEMSPTDLARLQPDDIATFSILKDATGAALYGSRGANGIILVTTKEGKEGKVNVSVRFESSMSAPTKMAKIADPITYMRLHNEAVRTRNPLGIVPYSDYKIANTAAGKNPMVFPANDWQKLMFKDQTFNHRFNFNLSGGGKIARYYLSATVNQDNGILNVNGKNNFNNNIDLKNYIIRSNVNINLTPTTEVIVRVHGNFEDYTGPLEGGSDLFAKVMQTSPVKFPPIYNADEQYAKTKNILFGNASSGDYLNPYAEMVKGYKDYSSSKFLAQAELNQKLDFVTEGLGLRGVINTNRESSFDIQRYYDPYYYSIATYDRYEDEYTLESLNDGSEALGYSEGGKHVKTSFYMQGAINYSRVFDEKHDVTGLLVGTMENSLSGNAGSLQASLAHRNMGLAGRLTYGFDTRYVSEFNFGYNGSERFSSNKRWGFFPSVGLGWILSNEEFYKATNFERLLPKIKIKGTYGLVGNDAVGSDDDRFFYLSNVEEKGDRGMNFGTDGGYARNGIVMTRYGNPDIGWETAYKTNLGVEVNLLHKLEIQADWFHENRKNILMGRANIPATIGIQKDITVYTNSGETESRGFEFSLDYNHSFSNGIWVSGRGNFTYATSKIKKYDEIDFSNTPWRSMIGRKMNTEMGYIAERLFVDDEEVRNSPTQDFGGNIPTMGGDIKYKDVNGDGKISELDKVAIGFPQVPEIIYGFGFSLGYKNLDVSAFFQGSARSSFWLSPYDTSPFIYNQRALLQAYADDHWSEENRNSHALWPRLAETYVNNNTQKSTWFMRDGSFLRLKSAEAGYTLPAQWSKKAHLKMIRLYVSGTNLLTFSKFKLWDPEMGYQGLKYPVQRVINAGIQVNF